MFSRAIALLFTCVPAYTPVLQPVLKSIDQSFAAMPTGTYRYLLDNGNRSSQTFLFRKSGSVVVGAELISRTQTNALVLNCFRGQAKGDRIIHITQVSPPYSPLSNWESRRSIEIATQTGQTGAASLEVSYLPTDVEQTALETCIQLFWR